MEMASISAHSPKVACSHKVALSTNHEKSARPFGLPDKMSLEEYHVDPLLRLSKYNYKLNIDVSSGDKMWNRDITILETGAVSNLIRADLVPSKSLSSIDTSKELVSLSSPSSNKK